MKEILMTLAVMATLTAIACKKSKLDDDSHELKYPSHCKATGCMEIFQ